MIINFIAIMEENNGTTKIFGSADFVMEILKLNPWQFFEALNGGYTIEENETFITIESFED